MPNDDIKAKLQKLAQEGGEEDVLFPRIMLSLLESAENSDARLAELIEQIAALQKSASENFAKAESRHAELMAKVGSHAAEVLDAIKKADAEAAARHAKTQKTIVLMGAFSLVAILTALAALFFMSK